MQLCILGFEGSHAADEAFSEILELDGARDRWLLEVGTLARPLVGRVRVGVTLPDGESKTFHEGDLRKASADLGELTGYYVSALAGPFGSMFAVDAQAEARQLGSDAEQRLFHLDEIKQVLRRNSSALVLIASERTCDDLIEMFDTYGPKVIRAEVEPELRTRLESLERWITQPSAQPEGAPA